jgi:hypothetical protein
MLFRLKILFRRFVVFIPICLSAGVTDIALAQVYRCVEDDVTVFSNASSNAKKKNCVQVQDFRPSQNKPTQNRLPLGESPKNASRVSRETPKLQSSSSSSNFPKIDAATQKYRDNDRAAILEEERRKEAALLSDLKKEFNNGSPERRTDERDAQRYAERIEKLRLNILRAETNVKSLERELQSVR